jgi:predicted kinase
MVKIHLVEGPVGAGKSTFAGQLALQNSGVHLNLDEWMVTLFSPDRPQTGFMDWYTSCKQRCLEQIWKTTCDLMDAGVNVVLELGLVQQLDRAAFYARVDGTDYDLDVIMLDVPKETRRQRVLQRNAEQSGTFRMVVSDEIFQLADAAWQAPDEEELTRRSIQVL